MKRLFFMVLLIAFCSSSVVNAGEMRDRLEAELSVKCEFGVRGSYEILESCEAPEDFTAGVNISRYGAGPCSFLNNGGIYKAKYSLGSDGLPHVIFWVASDSVAPCDKYKKLFDPPARDCKFELGDCITCYSDLEYTKAVSSTCDFRDSQGRVTQYTENYGVGECVATHIGISPVGTPGEPFNPSDEKICIDSPGGGGPGGGTGGPGGGTGGPGGGTGGPGGGSGGGTDPCVGEGCGTGGGGDTKEPCEGEDCEEGEGEGEGEGETPGGGTGGETPGGGTGGDGKGDGEEEGTWSGDGGFGGLGSLDGMDKGYDDAKGTLDGLIDAIRQNETIRLIEGHRYISTSDATCTYSYSLWGHTQEFSFCEYGDTLRTFGHVLLGLITLMGFVYVVRMI